MTEALLVALLAGVLATALTTLTLPIFLRAAPEGIPRLAQVGLDLPTLAAAFGLVLIAALACGAVPAMRASSPDLMRLREGGRGATGRRHWGRDALVVGQTALALVLLIGSSLLVRSFQKLRNVDPGYDTADIYTFQFAPEQERLTDGPTWGQLHLDFMDRLRGLPGVTDGRRGQQPSAGRGHRRRPLVHRCHDGRERRHPARPELYRRRLFPGDGHRPAPGPHLPSTAKR